MSSNGEKSATVITKSTITVNESGTIRLEKRLSDTLSSEQPLQILLHSFDAQLGQWQTKPLAMMMRTPEQDEALVIGFLLSQNIIKEIHDIAKLDQNEPNLIEVSLAQHCLVDWQQLTRTFVSHSGCGVCGKTTIKQLALSCSPLTCATSTNEPAWLSARAILTMPNLLNAQQPLFEKTGGCHGVAIWKNNALAFVAEDVGRHNAVDKVIGNALNAQFDFDHSVLILSGRISFELVQKAVIARIGVIVAVGAPSDLAVATAKQFNITLIGFTKENQANVYCDNERILVDV